MEHYDLDIKKKVLGLEIDGKLNPSHFYGFLVFLCAFAFKARKKLQYDLFNNFSSKIKSGIKKQKINISCWFQTDEKVEKFARKKVPGRKYLPTVIKVYTFAML